MKLVTINLSYYNQSKSVLEKHLRLWMSYPTNIRKYFNFVIIDDSSQPPIEQILDFNDYSDINLSVYQVRENLYCNIAGVRNLGAQVCETPYLLILDMDTLVNSTMASQVLKLVYHYHQSPVVFKFNRKCEDTKHPKHLKIHPAVCLIRKKDYWDIGGCEEDLVGNYGYTDPCFWHRAQGKVRIIHLEDIFLEYIEEGESDIERDTSKNKKVYLERKEKNNWSSKILRFSWTKLDF